MTIVPYLAACVSLAILLFNRARIAIFLLLGQYLLAFVLSLSFSPLRSSLARLVGGILVSTILYSSHVRFQTASNNQEGQTLPRSLWFRAITGIIIFTVAWAFAQQRQSIPAALGGDVFLGAIFNMCLGALMLGLYQSALEAAVGLLTLLIGFDLFYGGIEPSLAIVVLMISLQIIISLAISYIMSVRHSSAEIKDGFR
jgi:hypothetical protein